MTHRVATAPVGGQIPRGVADYFWQAARQRRELEQALLAFCRTWGYQDVLLPTFEYADTLSARGNVELRAELCRFIDRDGSMLALRADMTIAVARLVATRLHDLPMPQRFCYAGSVFRDVEPRAGQQREFIQAGVELIGSHLPEADAEVLALCAKALAALGIDDYRIVVGQMQYFGGLLQALGLTPAQTEQLHQAIDRNSAADLATFLRATPLSAQQAATVRALPALSGRNLDAVLAQAEVHALNPTMAAAVDNLRAIFRVLAAHGVLDRFVLDLTEIHDLGYYTGISFEALAPGLGFRLASGGRYDDLVGTFGAPQPAVGLAFGLERLLLAQRSRQPAPGRLAPAPDLLVATGNEPPALHVVDAGRELGLHLLVDLEHRRGAALCRAARTLGAPYALEWAGDAAILYELDAIAADAAPAQIYEGVELMRRLLVIAEAAAERRQGGAV